MIDIGNYKYVPILALQPAEMVALEELPSQDKDLILPLISLKRWTTSKSLEKSIDRIKRAIDSRFCIVDIDKEYLANYFNEETGEYPDQEVFEQLKLLKDSSCGYKNWINFVAENNKFIPVLQLEDLSELDAQVKNMKARDLFFVTRIDLRLGKRISSESFSYLVNVFVRNNVSNTLFVFDFGDINRKDLLEKSKYLELFQSVSSRFPEAIYSFSGTSFPYSFAGSYKGELPIYERQIHNYLFRESSGIKIVYSDRGSTRAGKMGGGGGVVPVRIDYPLKHDWRFVRKEPEEEKEKEDLYQEAAREIVSSEFWMPSIRIWATQMIERTVIRDPYGISSPAKATAVRINMHLFQQIHYNDILEEVDTEEDWED